MSRKDGAAQGVSTPKSRIKGLTPANRGWPMARPAPPPTTMTTRRGGKNSPPPRPQFMPSDDARLCGAVVAAGTVAKTWDAVLACGGAAGLALRIRGFEARDLKDRYHAYSAHQQPERNGIVVLCTFLAKICTDPEGPAPDDFRAVFKIRALSRA